MKTILDLRRYLILTESRIPPEIERAYRNLEWFGDPVGMGRISRDELAESIRAETIEGDHPVDFLFWVGCQGYFHERNRKTISTLLRFFQRLKLRFAILGREETCCGDLARRTGNEYLFETLVKNTLNVFKTRGVTKIVTHCPHCFNVFKNEYPQWGAKLSVFHYTELLRECLDKGLLPLPNDVVGRATLHDPCYLSRYNRIASEPRSLLKSIPHLQMIEMGRSKETTSCCGAGGGSMWLGKQIGRKINEMRAEEALGTKADYLVTTCPYCLNMLEDGLKGLAKENVLQVVDIAELLDRAVG